MKRERESIDDGNRRLFKLALDAPRANLRTRIALSAKTLASRAHKYLTLADEYNARRRYAKAMNEPEPPYEQRLRALTAHLLTRQSDPGCERKYPDNYDYAEAKNLSTAQYVRKYQSINGSIKWKTK